MGIQSRTHSRVRVCDGVLDLEGSLPLEGEHKVRPYNIVWDGVFVNRRARDDSRDP